MATAKHIGKITLKSILWLLAIVIGIVILIVIALQFSGVQNFVAQKAANYLENTLNTQVDIGRFTTDWRNTFVLKDVYVEDQQQDTLWYSERLGVDMAILSLLSGELNISNINLDKATVKLHIREDSTTNYDFILDAFATDTAAAQPADTTAAMAIDIGTVNLEQVYFVLKDEAGGNFVRTRIGQLKASMEEINLDKQRYLIDEVELENTWVDYEQTKLPPETEDSEPLDLDFGLNRVALENVKLKYVSRPADQRIELDLGKSELIADNIDLKEARIDLKSFALQNTDVIYVQQKYKPVDSLAVNPAKTAEELDQSVEEAAGQPMDWVLTLGELDVNNLDVAFDNFNVPKQAEGMDYDHLKFTDIVIDAEDIFYSLNQYRADINQLTLEEQGGFELINLQALVEVDENSASLTNLDLRTKNSFIQSDLAMTYPSLEAITEKPAQVGVRADINRSYIGMQDIKQLFPEVAANPSFRKIAGSTVNVTAKVTGTLENLQLENLQLAGLQNTNVDVSGEIRNAMDPDNLYLDLDIGRLTTTRTDIEALLPAETIPEGFRLPNEISLQGNYKGSLTSFDANTELKSSFGDLNLDIDTQENGRFTASASSSGFNLNQLFTDSLGLGEIAFSANASGTNLMDPDALEATVDAQIGRFTYNNYTYNDITVDADINRGIYDVDAVSRDENLAFTLDGKFNLRDTLQPAYTFDLALREANLGVLNFYPEPLSVKGQFKGTFTGADASTISGRLTGDELVIRHNNKAYPVDSLLLTLEQSGEMASLDLASDVVDAEMQFENSLATLPTALQKYFSNYFDLQPDPPYPADVNLQDFTATIDLKKTGVITSFVPGLEQLQTAGPITAVYDGGTNQLKLDGNISKVVYTDYTLQNIDLEMRGNRERLAYKVDLQKLISPSLKVNNATLEGAARDDNLQVKLTVAGSDTTDTNFMLGGIFNSLGEGYRFTFQPDEVIINGDLWNVPEDNSLQFDTDFIYANNIVLQRNNSSLSLNSTGPVGPGAPLQVNIQNFDLGYLMASFQPSDSLLLDGTLNGEATVQNLLSGTLSFTSDLEITDFTYEGVPVGNLALEANSTGGNRYNIDAALTGNSNQVNIAGFMETQPNATLLNLNANIDRLNLASLEGFTAGLVKDMGGLARGDLEITGTLDNPEIIGPLYFDQAQFNITELGSLFTLENERLLLTEEGIRFPNFTITDSLGNDLVVEGRILTETYTDFQFDLEVDAERFLVLNSTAADNDLYYGTVFVDAEATITGDMAVPVIQIDARVLDGSEFTTVIPADQIGAAEREGIVEFVDLNPEMTRIIGGQMKQDTVEVTGFQGVDLEARITITEATPITIIIDPLTGDQLTVRGTADPLFIGMQPSGEINMNGRYTATEGKYSMEFYDIASRELEIVEGSYINWNGDPLQAIMDITAIYTVEAAPQELVSSQAGGTLDPVLRNQVPFQVLVYVEGELLTPEISFDIQLPEEERGGVPPIVVSSLEALRQDESQQNKQVFALLVLGRFLAPDPLASSGGGFEGTARNSLGGVLTDQLNQLTNRYAGGLGLELGIDSYQDYSSGSAQGRTDLNVALSQQFLNDRLTVRVGTDIGLEGGSQANQTMSGFGGDISVEYSLTEDGRLRVRAFQRNQYEGIIEGGDVRATGVSLIYVREYNNFSDLFRSLEARRAREAERKLEEAQKTEEELQ
ncbi:translocation/assembly module TamB domain-containing protein [Pontibacter locisalis]|uniref:Translocation/assembly module TamB domain-containing protein n=1 Tax=Pontibacter locisalis TaxID=1719035 RepID=A0ABW5INI5_9BACT